MATKIYYVTDPSTGESTIIPRGTRAGEATTIEEAAQLATVGVKATTEEQWAVVTKEQETAIRESKRAEREMEAQRGAIRGLSPEAKRAFLAKATPQEREALIAGTGIRVMSVGTKGTIRTKYDVATELIPVPEERYRLGVRERVEKILYVPKEVKKPVVITKVKKIVPEPEAFFPKVYRLIREKVFEKVPPYAFVPPVEAAIAERIPYLKEKVEPYFKKITPVVTEVAAWVAFPKVMHPLYVAAVAEPGLRRMMRAYKEEGLRAVPPTAIAYVKERPIEVAIAGLIAAPPLIRAIRKVRAIVPTIIRRAKYIPIEKVGYPKAWTIPMARRIPTEKALRKMFVAKRYALPGEPTGKLYAWKGVADIKKVLPKVPAVAKYELPGTYVSPILQPYWFRLPGIAKKYKMIGLGIPSPFKRPAGLRFEIPGLSVIPKAVRKRGLKAMQRFLIEKAKVGYAYMPLMKREYEAIITPTTEVIRTGFKFYTKVLGERVPLLQYRALPGLTKKGLKTIQAGKLVKKYVTPSEYYLYGMRKPLITPKIVGAFKYEYKPYKYKIPYKPYIPYVPYKPYKPPVIPKVPYVPYKPYIPYLPYKPPVIPKIPKAPYYPYAPPKRPPKVPYYPVPKKPLPRKIPILWLPKKEYEMTPKYPIPKKVWRMPFGYTPSVYAREVGVTVKSAKQARELLKPGKVFAGFMVRPLIRKIKKRKIKKAKKKRKRK